MELVKYYLLSDKQRQQKWIGNIVINTHHGRGMAKYTLQHDTRTGSEIDDVCSITSVCAWDCRNSLLPAAICKTRVAFGFDLPVSQEELLFTLNGSHQSMRIILVTNLLIPQYKYTFWQGVLSIRHTNFQISSTVVDRHGLLTLLSVEHSTEMDSHSSIFLWQNSLAPLL